MTAPTRSVAEVAPAPGADTPVLSIGDSIASATGSTCESRMDDLLARLADLDAISAFGYLAWDRLQERRSA